jgi:hypothetical protein
MLWGERVSEHFCARLFFGFQNGMSFYLDYKQLTPPVPCVKTIMPAFGIKGPNARAFIAVPAAPGREAISSNVRCGGAGMSSLSSFSHVIIDGLEEERI